MKPSERYKLDERNHVEILLLEQLSGLGWKIIDLTDEQQTPADTFRDNFTEVVMMDEAHRSQYKMLGAKLDRSISNATKLAIPALQNRQSLNRVRLQFSHSLPCCKQAKHVSF